jgi:molybdopterin-binding protein
MSTSIRNRLPGTIEQIVSDKVVSEIVINTAAGPVTSIITTGLSEADESQKGRRRFRHNQGDRSVSRGPMNSDSAFFPDAVIRVFDEADNEIETHEHAGEFKNRRTLATYVARDDAAS